MYMAKQTKGWRLWAELALTTIALNAGLFAFGYVVGKFLSL